ncbi:hypothetical protein IMAU10217_01602 [Lactiplantibacillus plantarum]|nr:hypothetical protein [Lactiplantibacillus plantarum]
MTPIETYIANTPQAYQSQLSHSADDHHLKLTEPRSLTHKLAITTLQLVSAVPLDHLIEIVAPS